MQVEVDGQALVIDGARVEIGKRIKQAMDWPEQGAVVVLLGPDRAPDELLVVSPEGEERFRSGPPEDFEFYYLTRGRGGAAVVCVTFPGIKGWQDWNFAIELERGELERYAPSK